MKTIVKMPAQAKYDDGVDEVEVALSLENGHFELDADCWDAYLELPMDKLRQALGIIDPPQQSTEPPLNTLVQHLGQKLEKVANALTERIAKLESDIGEWRAANHQAMSTHALTIEGNSVNLAALVEENKRLIERLEKLEVNAKEEDAATVKSFGERMDAAISALTDQEFEEDLAG